MAVATKKRSRRKPRLSRLHKPAELSLKDWQIALRREFGPRQPFKLENLGPNRVFSEFAVTNPESGRSYRVVIRGEGPGINYCTCPDYETNTLGTCKHIEFTLDRLRRRHAAALRKAYAPPFPEIYVRYGTRREVVFSPGADCPAGLRRLAARFFRPDGTLKPAAFASFDAFVSGARRLCPHLRLYDDALVFIARARDDAKRRARLAKRYGGQAGTRALLRLLKVPLYPYQREGALFAATAGRAIIADEMGLGKTIQAIAVAEILARDGGVDRVLIVCPTSLKYQWPIEIARFSRRPVRIIEGLSHQRKALYAEEGFFKIVNYELIHRDLDAIAAWRPDLIILDEAQRIKNWQTRAARSVKQLESPYALVLTGTPLENRLEELHSITEFVDRHRLGPLFAFKAAHEICEEDSNKVIGYRDLNRITKTLAPILIRRTKQQVLRQLPPRLDKQFFVPMTEQQMVHHAENQEIVAQIVARWRRYRFLTEADQLRLRIALQYMRMACDNTYLIDKKTRHGTKVEELARLLEEIFEDPKTKVVIFSQWVRMNELVAEMLDDRTWGHVHLHGGVPGKERKHLIRTLRDDPDCRVFLSTDAGGVGLNLQRASCVINMDLPWNPAVLEQRIGRVHRLGQERPVRVVNFVSEGTIEHGMLRILSFKKSMFTGVLDGTEDRIFMGESAMKRFMKTVETATEAVPEVRPTPDPDAAAGAPPAAPAAPESAGPEAGSGPRAAVGAKSAGTARAAGAPPRSDRAGQTRSPGGNGHPPASPPALGDLLNQAAGLLQSIGQALAGQAGGPGAATREKADPSAPVRVETDPATGRSDLRIALPEPDVLREWIERLAAAFQAALPTKD